MLLARATGVHRRRTHTGPSLPTQCQLESPVGVESQGYRLGSEEKAPLPWASWVSKSLVSLGSFQHVPRSAHLYSPDLMQPDLMQPEQGYSSPEAALDVFTLPPSLTCGCRAM